MAARRIHDCFEGKRHTVRLNLQFLASSKAHVRRIPPIRALSSSPATAVEAMITHQTLRERARSWRWMHFDPRIVDERHPWRITLSGSGNAVPSYTVRSQPLKGSDAWLKLYGDTSRLWNGHLIFLKLCSTTMAPV